MSNAAGNVLKCTLWAENIRRQTRNQRHILPFDRKKVERLKSAVRSAKDIERILIAPNGASDDLRDQLYFDHILTIEDMLPFQ